MITAFASRQAIDPFGAYRDFLEREDDSSGTLVLHHGRVKRPGKQIADFSSVELVPAASSIDEGLAKIARLAKDRFGLNQVLVVHRLGTVAVSDTVLLVIVSASSRDPCFSACAWIVDELKKETLIALIERP
ncbi:MAG: molybdenum cofactor biosynthesis protein MoaE [Treponema sp.]|nr:molybdenum cofactor biosynthesis protein MoaE [Treponema sp.]